MSEYFTWDLNRTKIVLIECSGNLKMLKISKLTDYATVIMSYLAKQGSQRQVATEVSHATGIALPTVSKVLKQLTKAHILNSVRGAHGGYQLARPAEQISVAAIINALEGPIALTECSLSSDNCDHEGHCDISGNWSKINQVIQAALESVTLADMVVPETTRPFEIKIPVENILNAQR